MAQHFDWKANGLDKRRFEALTKLLRLRYNGQVTTPTAFDENDLADADDADSVKAAVLPDFGTSSLQRAFLDRLAELVANEKGGRYVAATLIVANHEHTTVFVARNSRLRPSDHEFLEKLGSVLRNLANQDSDDDEQALWKALLAHYEARIQDYISNLIQLLKRYMPIQDSKKPPNNAQVELLVVQLNELNDATFAQYPSPAERNNILVLQAHSIYKAFSIEDFDKLAFSGTRNLRAALGFLGRLRTTYSVFLRAARTLPAFDSLRIMTLKSPDSIGPKAGHKKGKVPSVGPEAQSWTLTKLFDHLGVEFNDANSRAIIGRGKNKSSWNKSKIIQEFEKLKSGTWQVHAETQLLPLYNKSLSEGDLAIEYIGCSKRSCFLCWNFLRLFSGAKTRGCHGKLYNLWGFPSFQDLAASDAKRIAKAIKELEALIVREVSNGESEPLPLAKESTVGRSTLHTIAPGHSSCNSSTARIKSDYLQGQRANILFPSIFEEMSNEETMDSLNETSVQGSKNTVTISGPCRNFDCEKTTTRRCSHCTGALFCSVTCEDQVSTPYNSHFFVCNRRPITTADLLLQDCFDDKIPEDPQVREDYGFERCKKRTDETKLFGLFIGILKYQTVSSEELHRWKTDGVLAERIIEVFSRMPENCRGGYYNWFLSHRYILEMDGTTIARDEDDAEKYVQERYAEGRTYLDPQERNIPIEDLHPFAKQYCFFFLSMVLGSARPPPIMQHLDLWFDFGYVVCSTDWQENGLANAYGRLLVGNKIPQDYLKSMGGGGFTLPDIPNCTFEEFWRSWEEGSLMGLFEKYNVLEPERWPELGEFLSFGGKSSSRPSVWRLRHFLAIENGNVLTARPEIAAAAMEYGFDPRLDVGTMMELRKFYEELFRWVLPSAIDLARKLGKLHEVAAEWTGEAVDKRVERVLRGLPAHDPEEIAASYGAMENSGASSFDHTAGITGDTRAGEPQERNGSWCGVM